MSAEGNFGGHHERRPLRSRLPQHRRAEWQEIFRSDAVAARCREVSLQLRSCLRRGGRKLLDEGVVRVDDRLLALVVQPEAQAHDDGHQQDAEGDRQSVAPRRKLAGQPNLSSLTCSSRAEEPNESTLACRERGVFTQEGETKALSAEAAMGQSRRGSQDKLSIRFRNALKADAESEDCHLS